jgi:hypothetical protein
VTLIASPPRNLYVIGPDLYVAERHADPTSILQLNHAEVLATRHDIMALIDALRGDQVIAPRGAALARLLAESSTSPLLWAQAGHTVQQAVSEAIAAL